MKWLSILLLLACSAKSNDPQPVEPPMVETVLVSTTDTKAIAACKSTAPIRGICWGTSPNPDKNDSWAEDDTVVFTVEARKEYYIRAFATNGAGTVYGKDIKFLSICHSDIGGVVQYSTVVQTTLGDPCDLVTGETIFVDHGDGIYSVGDASFGLYGCAWGYGPATGITLEDTCGKLKFFGSDQYGITYSVTIISRTPTALVIQWANDFGDSGISTLQRPDGW